MTRWTDALQGLLERLWMRLLGRSTLRPVLTDADWRRQDHGFPDETGGLHYPGDKCPDALHGLLVP